SLANIKRMADAEKARIEHAKELAAEKRKAAEEEQRENDTLLKDFQASTTKQAQDREAAFQTEISHLSRINAYQKTIDDGLTEIATNNMQRRADIQKKEEEVS